jgi:hypothetical protein
MYNPPNAAYTLEVGGIFLQLQGFVVERLQQFLRGLKEELPHLCVAIVRTVTHTLTSSFW